MNGFVEFYLFIGAMWFYQEWKETKDVTTSLIMGAFWIFEIFHKLSK